MSSTLFVDVTQLAPTTALSLVAVSVTQITCTDSEDLIRIHTTLILGAEFGKAVDEEGVLRQESKANTESLPAAPLDGPHAPDVDMVDDFSPVNDALAPSLSQPRSVAVPFSTNRTDSRPSSFHTRGVTRTDILAARKKRRFAPYSTNARTEHHHNKRYSKTQSSLPQDSMRSEI